MVKNSVDRNAGIPDERATVQTVMSLLASVPDPEIPVVSIVDLGIVRDVAVSGSAVSVKITPTYSGCPAMYAIEEEIRHVLLKNGFTDVAVEKVFAPAWTTEWLTEPAKTALREYGISPPVSNDVSPLLNIELPKILCPVCGSDGTRLTSEFGSTPCKSYYFCDRCRQPFEYLKSI